MLFVSKTQKLIKPMMTKKSFKQKKLLCSFVVLIVWTLHTTFDSKNSLIVFKPTYDRTLQQPSIPLSISSLLYSLTSSNTTSIPSFQIKPTNTTIKPKIQTYQNNTSTYNNTRNIPYEEKRNKNDNKNDTYIIRENQEGNKSSYSSTETETWKATNNETAMYKNIERKKEKEMEYKLKSLIPNLQLEDPLLPFTSCGKLNFTAPTVCGTRKCFVTVKDESNIGYLIASLSFHYISDIMSKGYNYTKYLEDTYNIKHFSLDKPKEIPILLPCIQRHLEAERGFYYNPKSKFKQGFHPDYGLVIQKTTIAPTPHLVVSITKMKRDYYYSMLESFLKNNVQNKTQFANRLEQEIHPALIMLRKERCLLDDFQVLVDIYGNLYHIDLDRCFENRKIHKTVDEVISQINTTLQASIIQARFMGS